MAIRGFAPLVEPGTTAPALVLDESQQEVLDLADAASAAVIGAPGTGKTTAMIELVAERVLGRGWAPDELVVLTPSRASATSLRDRLATRLGVPTLGPLARTVNSLAFDIVRDAAAQAGAEPPRLLTGAEQDQIIADLLDGEFDEPELGAYWPDQLDPDIRRLRGFRTELRDLMMRAVEHGILPADLAGLGRSAGRPEWTAAARFIDLYDDVKASFRERHFDSTELVQEAAAIVRVSPPALLGRLRLVVLEDAQESTESTMMLVRALAAQGVAVIAVGDPDISTGAFRGALPEVLGRLAQQLDLPRVEEIHLSTVHRHGGEIRSLTSTITNRIGTAGAGRQRRAGAGERAPSGAAVAYSVNSRAEEIALIARRLRERHVLGGVPWGEMAVIVRTGVASLSQSLQALEVQTTVASARAALRDEYAVRGLVLLIELGLGRQPLTAATAVDLLLGPLGGLDAVTLRRLKHALRHEELAGEGDRSGDELVAEALAHPEALATIDTRVARRAARVAANLAAVRQEAEAGATIEELLWGVWQRSGLEKLWFEQSMGAGLVAEEANRHLDAVVALFSSAKRFVERSPDAAPAQFLDAWVSADVPEDTLAPRSAVDAVTVGTPASVIGREFEVVVIAGVQENVWPNLRIRGSLLGSGDLAAAWAGTLAEGADKRLEVMHDELRLFAQAVSRARGEVVVTAVANDDSLPSAFLRLVPEGDPSGLQRHPLSLRGMVGQLRRELTSTGSGAAAAGLARLAEESVPGAHPSAWYGLAEPSTLAPLVDLTQDDAHVRVSPSRMEAFETCALHWMIDQVGGGSSSTASNLGTIIHSVAEEAALDTADHSPAALYAAVEKRWGELYFESDWHSRVERTRARELTDRLSAYLDEFDRSGGRLLATEKNFELDLGQARLRGSIDRVESYPDGTAVIVDLKTGKRDPSTDDGVVDHPQLGAYQLAFASGAIEGLPEGMLPGGAKLVIVSKGSRGKAYTEPRQAAFDAEQLEAFRERVVADAVGMADRVFVAQIGTHCLDPWSFGRCTIHVVKAVSS